MPTTLQFSNPLEGLLKIYVLCNVHPYQDSSDFGFSMSFSDYWFTCISLTPHGSPPKCPCFCLTHTVHLKRDVVLLSRNVKVDDPLHVLFHVLELTLVPATIWCCTFLLLIVVSFLEYRPKYPWMNHVPTSWSYCIDPWCFPVKCLSSLRFPLWFSVSEGGFVGRRFPCLGAWQAQINRRRYHVSYMLFWKTLETNFLHGRFLYPSFFL
jgi:hypothetical protein